MPYALYMGGVRYPVPPAKITTKVQNQNKTLTLINDGEINFLKHPGLMDIQFDLLLPQVQYPFAVYENGFQSADWFLGLLKKLKEDKKPFTFQLSQTEPAKGRLVGIDHMVSLEDYEISQDAENGFDIMVTVKLKEYSNFKTQTAIVTTDAATGQKTAVVQNDRQASNMPKKKNHTVVKGDSLWNIAKKYLGDGSKYTAVYAANRALIDKRNQGSGNAKYTIYPGQVLVIP